MYVSCTVRYWTIRPKKPLKWCRNRLFLLSRQPFLNILEIFGYFFFTGFSVGTFNRGCKLISSPSPVLPSRPPLVQTSPPHPFYPLFTRCLIQNPYILHSTRNTACRSLLISAVLLRKELYNNITISTTQYTEYCMQITAHFRCIITQRTV